MSMRLDGWKLASAMVGMIVTLLTLACSLAFSLGVLDGKVNDLASRMGRIEDAIDNGGICRTCVTSIGQTIKPSNQ